MKPRILVVDGEILSWQPLAGLCCMVGQVPLVPLLRQESPSRTSDSSAREFFAQASHRGSGPKLR